MTHYRVCSRLTNRKFIKMRTEGHDGEKKDTAPFVLGLDKNFKVRTRENVESLDSQTYVRLKELCWYFVQLYASSFFRRQQALRNEEDSGANKVLFLFQLKYGMMNYC